MCYVSDHMQCRSELSRADRQYSAVIAVSLVYKADATLTVSDEGAYTWCLKINVFIRLEGVQYSA